MRVPALAAVVLWAAALAFAVEGCRVDTICVDGDIGCSLDTCSNRQLDGDETAVDCGGSCAACPAGSVCREDDDCSGGGCIDLRCCTSPCPRWSRAFGAGAFDAVTGATYLADGSLVVAGVVSGSVDLGVGPTAAFGGQDAMIAAFDADGACLWSRSFGGADIEWGSTLTVLPGDRIYVAISYRSNPLVVDTTELPQSGGDADLAVVELDRDGQLLQVKRLSSQGSYAFADAIAPLDGGVALVGSLGRIVLDDGTTISSPIVSKFSDPTNNIFVLSMDAALGVRWAKNVGGDDYEYPTDLIQLGDGEIVVTGLVSPGTDLGGTLVTAHTSVAMTFDASGALVRTIEIPAVAAIAAVTPGFVGNEPDRPLGADGALWMGGLLGGPLDMGAGLLVPSGSQDAWIARFEPSAAASTAWLSGDNMAVVLDLIPIGDGVVGVGKFTGHMAGVGETLVGADAGFMSRVDGDGGVRWVRDLGGIVHDTGATARPQGGFVVYGSYAGRLDESLFGAAPEPQGNYDAFIGAFHAE